MEKAVICSNKRNTIKTDLSVLLESLKFQMKCPDLQKQALLIIHSICEKREDAVDMLREMGGVVFVYNLSISSIVHPDVKGTALFVLCTLAEANVYCKNSLCRRETFSHVAHWLMKEEIPLTQKRVSVYLLSVLVTNNKTGQTLAQTTGCLDILLNLFRTTSPLSTDIALRVVNATQIYKLWASVCSALCGCVNNPQNEEGQRICVVAFPLLKIWLQQFALPRTEIFQPICSFIAMTVADNSCVKEIFSASGALDTLTLALIHQASTADTSLLSYQISVTISKTLSACIADKSSLASGLAQYEVVSQLVSLLRSPNLEPEDTLSVLLTLGHCTEASEKHQSQLMQFGGLPLIISFLIEDTNEEVRKAAAFIMQNCKQAKVPGLIVRLGDAKNQKPDTNLEAFRNSARELYHRIERLENRQTREDEEEHEDIDPTASTKGQGQPYVEAGCNNSMKLQTVRNIIKNADESKLQNVSPILSMSTRMAQTTGGVALCSMCKGNGALMSSHPQSLEGGRQALVADKQLFKPPPPLRLSVSKEMERTDEVGSRSRETGKEWKIEMVEPSLSQIRCAGCVLPFDEVASRNFTSLQSSCRRSCDMHKILQEATERFRTRQCAFLFKGEYQDMTVVQIDHDSDTGSAAGPKRSWKDWTSFTLTPLHGGLKNNSSTSYHKAGFTLTPMKMSHPPEERREGDRIGNDELEMRTDHCSTRRKRKDFSPEEIRYLLSGVNNHGFSWNSILWSYPFKPGRTNVDLAKKYRRLMERGETVH